MSDEDHRIQIFISYARDDDLSPPGMPDAKGFVTFLQEQLEYEFTSFGQPRPKIWRDTRKIADAEQFGPRIKNALSESSHLIVVLSQNWMARPWCRQELDYFEEVWAKKGKSSPSERIVVVGKRHVDSDKRPPLLQGQSGFRFYTRDDSDELGVEHEFFRGKIRDDRYLDCLSRLSAYLWREAGREISPRADDPPLPMLTEPQPAIPPSGRTVYLAKPTDDMREAYDRIVKELVGRGHTLVPDVTQDIPYGPSADHFIEDALAAAEFSVHLLGNKAGPTRENEVSIATLQLARAAGRVQSSPQGKDASASFRRIIWAPKILDDDAAAGQRDPISVLTQFDRQLPTDKVEGDHLSNFVEFLIDYMVGTAPQAVRRLVDADAKIYLYHSIEDSGYAADIAEALEERSVEPLFPAFQGPPAELAAYHHKNLTECDAIVLCWAAAPEVWVRTRSDELRDWRELGRTKSFAYRGLIAGPPPGDRKKFIAKRPPRKDIDLVVDSTESPRPSPEDIDKLVTTVHRSS